MPEMQNLSGRVSLMPRSGITYLRKRQLTHKGQTAKKRQAIETQKVFRAMYNGKPTPRRSPRRTKSSYGKQG